MQTNPESAAVEAVAWDYCPEIRIAVTDGKGGGRMTLNGHGAPAGISLYHGEYVSELQSALDALRGEVERLRGERSALIARIQSAVTNVAVPKMTESRAEYFKAGARATIDAVNAALTKESP